MMRFDVTCNMTLRTATGQDLHVCSLPSDTGQQQLLHEVIWVDGCERWAVSPQPGGERVLDVFGCQQEIRVAFAASLSMAPVWSRTAALRMQLNRPCRLPHVYSQPGELDSAQRITDALGPTGLRTPENVFAALPELIEWLRGADGSDLPGHRQSFVPGMIPSSDVTAREPEVLQLALAVFRALGVPARIVVGFAPEPRPAHPGDARCAYLELYGSGRWWLFQPNGQVPACGVVRTAVGSDLGALALVRGEAPAQLVRMDASVDPPPAWGLPSKISSRLLLSLDAMDTLDVVETPCAQVGNLQPPVPPAWAVASV